ncbi:MAG TPA: nucleotide disphospho-sugar-binding domain-containing protein [Solirubrobacteraceae bacterium]|nr:nucleotide disphospho-sugar-binding domain-containing protein [Solirubrobacteraceae bacterium]
MATIAITNIALPGHLGPATRLGATLVVQGHRVLTFAPRFWREQSRAAGLEFHPHEFAPGPIGGPVEFAAALSEVAERSSEELIGQLFKEGTDLVIHDSLAPWGRIAAEFLGLPRIVSHPLFPGGQPALPGVSDLPESLRDDSQNAAERVEVCRLAIARRWGVELGDWRGAMANLGSPTVVFSTQTILGPTELETGWHPIGPLMDPPPLRRPRPERTLVYAAFGTYSNTRPEVFRLVIEALAHEPIDVLISTGGGVAPSDLEPLPVNVVVRDHVDSREVLSRASLHITHGGAGSVHESLLAGVPMVCVPQDVDQFAWSERISALGAGEVVEPTPSAIRSAARHLLGNVQVGGRLQALADHLAAYDGAGRVAAAVSQAIA